MFFIYQAILNLLILFSPIILAFRFLKNKENKRSILEKICFSYKNRGNGKIIWFHGASVGEILSIVPILEKYEKHKSIKKFKLEEENVEEIILEELQEPIEESIEEPLEEVKEEAKKDSKKNLNNID